MTARIVHKPKLKLPWQIQILRPNGKWVFWVARANCMAIQKAWKRLHPDKTPPAIAE